MISYEAYKESLPPWPPSVKDPRESPSTYITSKAFLDFVFFGGCFRGSFLNLGFDI
jgi:hypothetical protein